MSSGIPPLTVSPTGNMTVRIIYSRHYDIGFFGLERLHPFDSRKYSRAWKVLRRRFGSRRLRSHLVQPAGPIGRQELLAVHSETYLDRELRSPKYLAGALEVPPVARAPARLTDWCVLRPMRWAAAGTVLGAREALAHGAAINLSGGYHHASPDVGHGFSIYADAAIAITLLRQSRELKTDDRVVYIDTDAHQGNGVERCFFDDPRVFIFDMYNTFIFPQDVKARRRIDCDLPLPLMCTDDQYLVPLRRELPRFLDAISASRPPRLAIYNAGTDPYVDDKLGGMRLSAMAILERDQFVLTEMSRRHIPWLMLPSGGYSRDSYKLIADTVSWAMGRWG